MLMPANACAELNRLRLENDWTWEQLAAEVRRVTGLHISVRTLHFNLRIADPNARPTDRTVFKIQKFLDAYHAAEAATPSPVAVRPTTKPARSHVAARPTPARATPRRRAS
jgi:hypothetical protein